MSFDALTIFGILATVLSGGFLVALAYRNDTAGGTARQLLRRAERPSPWQSER
jgi:hypothetical protein